MPIPYFHRLGLIGASLLFAAQAQGAPAPARLSESDRIQLESAAAACKAGDANSFVTAFAGSAAVRRKYSAAMIETVLYGKTGVLRQARVPAARYRDFPIVMEDYYFKSARPLRAGDTGEYVMLEINQSQSGQISAEWTRVHFDGKSEGGDDLGTAFTLDGKPYQRGGTNTDGQLLFEPSAGCWAFSADNRYQRLPGARP